MGLALRPDVYWAETDDGVCMLTHRGPVSFTGRSVHQLIETLASYLDGRFTLTELTASLSPQRRAAVEELVSSLLARDVLREVAPPRPTVAGEQHPDGRPAGHWGEYRRETAFVSDFREDGAEAFDAYRNSAALVIADDYLLTAVVRACLRSGLRRVAVAGPGDRGSCLEGLAERARRDPGQRLSLHHLGAESDAAIRALLDSDELADVRIVLHASGSVRRARSLDRICAGRDIHLAQALWCGDRAWLGPIGRVSPASQGWTSGWRRLQALRPATRHPVPDEEPDIPATGWTANAAAASQLVHGVLRSMTGPAGVRPTLTAVEAATLRSTTHAFLPHPFTAPAMAETAAQFLDRVSALEDGVPLEEENFSQRAARCADDLTGVFSQPSEGDLVQLPLHVCQIDVSDPVGLLSPREGSVTGAGLDFATARLRAALRALAGYASLTADPRRLLDHAGNALTEPGDDPDAALRALRAGRATGHLWGYRVADRRPLLVDAAAVFPALRGQAWPPPASFVAAYSWREAVETALLAHCHRLTRTDFAGATVPFPRLDPYRGPLDGQGQRYLSMLSAIGGTIAAYDVSGALGVPTVICYHRGTPAGCASGRTTAEALGEALFQTVLRYQAVRDAQPAYAPAAVPGLPRRLRGDTVRPLTGDPPLDAAAIGNALVELGHHPVIVPLDHDPEVAAVMPYIARVVLVDA